MAKHPRPFDKLIGIDYQPEYVPENSQTSSELREAQKSYATVYVLTVLADNCTGDFP